MPLAARLISASLCLALMSLSAAAHASQPVDNDDDPTAPRRRFRLEAVGGGAFGDTKLATGESLNAYGPGAGLAFGLVLPYGIHFGANFTQFFGARTTYTYPGIARFQYQSGATLLAGTIGWEIPWRYAYIRPQVSVGALHLNRSVECASASSSSWAPLADPMCATYRDRESTNVRWDLAVVPALSLGLPVGRFYGFVQPGLVIVKDANAYAIFAGFGVAL